jgi:hypothetical protein
LVVGHNPHGVISPTNFSMISINNESMVEVGDLNTYK